MKIYIAHSSHYDFANELYAPIKASKLWQEHEIILPHDGSQGLFNSKDLFKSGCDLLIAEVSDGPLGLGIELGWANAYGIRIICINKQGSKVSQSLKAVTDEFIEYQDSDDIIKKIEEILK